MNVGLGRSYFPILRWERLVHHQLINKCLLSGLANVYAKQGS